MRTQRLLTLAAVGALCAPLAAQSLAVGDHAVQFMGGEVSYGNHLAFATDRDFTAEAWVRATPLVTGSFDILRRFDPPNETKLLRLHLDGSVEAHYYGPLTSSLDTLPGALPFDQDWHHVALVVDGGQAAATLFVDGAVAASRALGPGFTGYSVNAMTVAGRLGSSGWQVSALRVSRTARYSAPFTPRDPGLDGHWPADPDTLLLVTGEFPELFHPGQPPGLADRSPLRLPPQASGIIRGRVSGMHGDMDRDGVLDDAEIGAGTSPFDLDTDDDGLSDLEEWLQPASTGTDPLVRDTDGDRVQDGTELGVTAPWTGEPRLDVLGTDLGVWQRDNDPATRTDPLDRDTDDDGFCESDEDLDLDGHADPGETDAAKIDTDGDWIQDGTESGLTTADVCPDTNLAVFVEDADPATHTDPLNVDSDFGSPFDGPLHDGREDLNRNGAVEMGETDPLDNTDDHFEARIPGLSPGQPYYLIVQDGKPGAWIDFYVCLNGFGRTPVGSRLGFDLGIQGPFEAGFPMLRILQLDAAGSGVHAGVLPGSIPTGLRVFHQALEVQGSSDLRLSYPEDHTIL
jgi:hypothetical protein